MSTDRDTFKKVLTKTDVGARGADGRKSNQSGVAVPRSQAQILPDLDPDLLNPSVEFIAVDEAGGSLNLRFIYFNGRLHGESTRNEYRITGISGYLRDIGAEIGDVFRLAPRGDGSFRISVTGGGAPTQPLQDSFSDDPAEDDVDPPIVRRSPEMWTVALYLSRFGVRASSDSPAKPPEHLGAGSWRETYEIFYPSLGGGRPITSFRNSLKNARDDFDAHVPESGRTGWRQEDLDRSPQNLGEIASEVFEEFADADEETLWDEIREHASLRTDWKPILLDHEADDHGIEYLDDDPLERALQAVRVRRGQPAFRQALMKLYETHCAISGWGPEAVLEAAHIEPHAAGGHNRPANGLLLRADVHTLFDAGLIVIEPRSQRVLIHVDLMDTHYEELMGSTLRARSDGSEPGYEFLKSRFDNHVSGYRHKFLPLK